MQHRRTIKLRSLSLLATLITFSTTGYAQQEVSATLAGHAVLPVNSTISAPTDAAKDLQNSGKYTTGKSY